MFACVHLQPWETYSPNLSVDLRKHHPTSNFLDKFAYYTVKSMRVPTDIFFQVRLFCPIFVLSAEDYFPVSGINARL